MKYRVLSIGVDTTSAPLNLVGAHSIAAPREEIIDTETNELFQDCNTIRDVEIVYEEYWNYDMSDDQLSNPHAKVKVLTVERI